MSNVVFTQIDTFLEPATHEPFLITNYEQNIECSRRKYRLNGAFKIYICALVDEL